jgi:lysozyme
MITSTAGRKFIEGFEGLYLHTYDDGTGVLTIGYGHTSAAGAPKVLKGQTITEAQADQYLSDDLGKVEVSVNNLVRVPINQNQYDALVSFQFNTGALGKSSVLKKLNANDFQGAADALLLYNRGGGQVMAGLTRRRQAERTMFLTPMAPPQSVPMSVGASTGVLATAAAFWDKDHWYIIAGVSALVILGLIYYFHKKG